MRKLYPGNSHHNQYDTDLGWEYLGNDGKFDFYVNHKRSWTSVVYGEEASNYLSPDYSLIISGKCCEVWGDQYLELMNRIKYNQKEGEQ